MQKKQIKSKTFEEDYFEGYYKGAVGKFTKKDLESSRNWFSAWVAMINKYIPMEKGDGRKVMEIGCSIGGFSSLLAERGFKVWATDVSSHAIKNAAKLTPNATFAVVDIREKITLKEKFDIIFALEVIEHLEFPKEALKNILDGLKPGGKAVISSPYPYPWNLHDPTHINVKYPHEWINLLRQVGFKNVSCHRFSLVPFFYKFHKMLHVIIPFAVPIPVVNNPILFIGEKSADEK